MTREEFIKILEEGGYTYEIEGDKIVVTEKGNVILRSLEELTPGVEFKNGGDVWRGDIWLNSLKVLPSGTVFENGGYVDLGSLKVLPSGVEFRNEGNVILRSLEELTPGVEFKNGGSVYLLSLIGGWFHEWEGNIEGIGSKRLLNKMISIGLFDR